MPPKKSGKKKGGKKSGKKSAKPTPPAGAEQLSELGKEFYNIQIKDLENRLSRYQHRCDELEVANGQFKDKYKQLETDKKEIRAFLSNELEKRHNEIADLKDRLIGLQESSKQEKEHYESEIQKLRTEYQEMKDQLTSDNMILGGKLASLEEFKVQKEDLMNKMASLEEALEKQKADHQDHLYTIEKKQVIDKDRLKKEMVMRVNQVAAEFRKVSNKQMAETTKRTIRENVSINAQLSKMSDKTLEYIGENDDLKAREKKQKQQFEMLEENEKALAKKNHSNAKVIRMLTEKCKAYEEQLEMHESMADQYQELEAESKLLRQQVESTREELQALSKENELFEEDLSRMRAEQEEEVKNSRKLEKVLQDAASAIKHALTTSSEEDVEESPSDKMEKRSNMLESLLVLLNSATALGLGPSPGELKRGAAPSPPPGVARANTFSSFPGSGKGIRKGEMPLSPIGRRPDASAEFHYRLGDFGLIPRPEQHILTNIEKMHELSQTSRLGTLKKVLTRSVAVQTISSPKAMFYADQLLSKTPADASVLHSLAREKQTLLSVSAPARGQGPVKVF